MATPNSVRGVSRVLEKLENSVKDGNYYEAHQMYRTLYFRYLSQKKYNELLDMLYKGSVLFLDHEQNISGADLGILLVEVLVKSETCNYAEWAPKLCTIFAKITTNTPERNTFIMNSIRWSSQNGHFNHGHPFLHQEVAQVYWNEKNFSQAKHHFLYSKDGKNCAKMLIELQTSQGFRSEIDLFIAQAVLQFLCVNNQLTANQTFTNYTTIHPNIRKSGPPYLLPLLNFIWLLLQAVESGKLATFVILCEQYKPSLKRDPAYMQYLDRIGQIFFGVPLPAPKSKNFFDNILDSFLSGFDEDSDEESSQQQSSSPVNNQSRSQQQPSTSNTKIEESSELD